MFIKHSQAQNLDRNLRDFAMKSYQEMTEGSRKFVFSPFLIQMTGAVLHLGAKGSTSYEMKDTFSKLLREKFLFDVESVTFSKPQKVLARINEYTASKTNHLMHRTVYEDEFFAFEKLLAVNVLYLRGIWKTEFPPKYTSIKDFYVKKNIVVPIHMMHLKAEFNYAFLPQIDATVLELPYEEGDEKWSMSMLVFLPDKHTTLEYVESKFYKLYFRDVLEAMSSTLVSVELPRFPREERGDFTYHLKEQFIANRPFVYAVICKSNISDEPLPLLTGRFTVFYDVILK
uniref:Serpin domain-containing protein n=1 Tax=Glossina austeni TaxID=7395 RepID=A0A1A9VY68_GLOAU